MRFDIASHWYRPKHNLLTRTLLPFAAVFGVCARLRRKIYQRKAQRFSVPVIVVGNISVGGTGKTPFVIWLANFLREQGYTPGIVSRGVGGQQHTEPHWVKKTDAAKIVGDEALLLAEHTHCPLVIHVNRVAAVQELLQHARCDVVISDDGLQHYRMHRDIEIVIVDGERRFGNGSLLPAGPLREAITRLEEVDFVVVNSGDDSDTHTMMLTSQDFVALKSGERKKISEFTQVHAVAGIGNPERFFLSLRQQGINIIPHSFPDHYLYQASDLNFADSLPIIMTEKDAVKCKEFAQEHYWYLPVSAKIDHSLPKKLLEKLKTVEVRDAYKNDFINNTNGCEHRNQSDSLSE